MLSFQRKLGTGLFGLKHVVFFMELMVNVSIRSWKMLYVILCNKFGNELPGLNHVIFCSPNFNWIRIATKIVQMPKTSFFVFTQTSYFKKTTWVGALPFLSKVAAMESILQFCTIISFEHYRRFINRFKKILSSFLSSIMPGKAAKANLDIWSLELWLLSYSIFLSLSIQKERSFFFYQYVLTLGKQKIHQTRTSRREVFCEKRCS